MDLQEQVVVSWAQPFPRTWMLRPSQGVVRVFTRGRQETRLRATGWSLPAAGRGSTSPRSTMEKRRKRPLGVMCCICGRVRSTSGVPQTAADLLHGASRLPWARSRHSDLPSSMVGADQRGHAGSFFTSFGHPLSGSRHGGSVMNVSVPPTG
jgi:hypothetical protein